MKNFAFLEDSFPSLANLGNLAEAYRQSDPNSALIKLGMLCESIVSMMFKFDRVREPFDSSAVKRIDTLEREGLLPKDVVDVLHLVRKARNKAVHEGWGDEESASQFLPVVHSVAGWFAHTYGPLDLQIPTYSLTSFVEEPIEQLEGKEARLKRDDENKAEQSTPVSKRERASRASRAANQRPRTEAETRLLIDEQLRNAGWEADTERLRYAHGTRPEAGRNLAIAEWPTNSTVGRSGRADYALFIGEALVAVIEAKADHVDIPSVLDYQAKDYARLIKPEHYDLTLGHWHGYRVPFLFATNARPYLDQLKTKSGVWFLDVCSALNTPRALHGWPSPEGLQAILEADSDKANQTLASYSDDLLTDPSGLNLRDYQVAAIHAAEKAVSDGQRHALLAMATGTGKTRTVLGMIYRFLKAKRFRRILFLVDRTALGEQALDAFQDVKLEELMSLDQLYDIKGLEDLEIDLETKVRVSTVQAMVKRVFYPDDQVVPAVTDYDLIIVDEAHRGYLLDKEMTDDEVLYRDQFDYQSAYRNLIDYFDAFKIALTATPALHTTEIFGTPVYTYSYREAVMDGWLVDHDAPHRLATKLSTDGISFGKGETLPIYDPQTGEITNSEELTDEVTFDVEQFNRQVITEEFNRTVLAEIARDLDPSSPDQFGKTLIYAVDDAHADMIVAILKEIYAASGVEPEAIMKITGSVAGGNKKKVQEAIKRFKNERYPSIVVTVDLLSTGIDVPSITSLVFMRRVKSRILFEQMLGRATRLCSEIDKDKFDIYDPVGVYDALEQVNTMKPVAVNPNTRFTDLLEGLTVVDDEDSQKSVIEQIVAKLQRRKQRMKAAAAEQVTDLAGGQSMSTVIDQLKQLSPADATAWVHDHAELFAYLDSTTLGEPRRVVISHQPDELLTHTRDFGDSASPGDYLDEFTQFIKSNTNEIAALNIICTRPADLTREQLKSLKLALDREGFTEQKLSSAVSQLSNKEIAADIISLVRRYALGSPLVSHEQRVRNAVSKLKAGHSFSKVELGWLSRVEQYLENELLLTPEVFDEDPRFRQQGGFARVNIAFRGNLDSVINEFNKYLYETEESVA
ncbi:MULTISPECIES: type I restriction-modification system endonuclease [unclassified Corynebacterium]|uniref:type I restriction-modification system endonuclease n=1 Tax=unclassified Corynebacterium TaxID=2624378 RepID=UPI0008A4F6AA|nr:MULTISPECIES: type I restriction-modification system endonuclease [unclassified Corynebacterium]OFN08275.1 type I restriction endonuclease subunit R [Corynebacterium sp. HMSC074C11]